MYSFGNMPQVPRDPYAPASAAGGNWPGADAARRPHHGAHLHRRAQADGVAGNSFAGTPADGAGQLGGSGNGLGNDAMQGLLRDFGQFLQSALDRLAALLGGAQGGSIANAFGDSRGANAFADGSSSGGGPQGSGGSELRGFDRAAASGQPGAFQLLPGTPLDLGNGESVLLGNDGSLTVSDADAQGGRILLTLTREGGAMLRNDAPARGPQPGALGPGIDPVLDDASATVPLSP
jgi:hypothetical protein